MSTDFAPLIASVSKASAWETLTVHGRPVSVAVPDVTTLPASFSAPRPATVMRSALKSPSGGDRQRRERDVDELRAGAATGRRSRTCPRRRRAPGRSPRRPRGRARRSRRRASGAGRLPSGCSENASASSEPCSESESRLAPPSTTSEPSPGFQLKRSKSPPSSATSEPLPPLTSSKPGPPIRWSLPGPPISTLSPAPPASVRSIVATDALMMSSPPRPSIVR